LNYRIKDPGFQLIEKYGKVPEIEFSIVDGNLVG
jgi:hypothetical protein